MACSRLGGAGATRPSLPGVSVQLAGPSSWVFAESFDEALVLALFLRDALALPVAPATEVPPPLLGDPVPDRSPALRADAASAAVLWSRWWTALVHSAAERRAGQERPWSADDPMTTVARSDAGEAGSWDALRQAALLCAAEGSRWADQAKRSRAGGGRESAFPSGLVRGVAEDVAFDRDVDPGRVKAAVVVLPVSGSWWLPAAPGLALCSQAVPLDLRLAHLVLRTAFESGLQT